MLQRVGIWGENQTFKRCLSVVLRTEAGYAVKTAPSPKQVLLFRTLVLPPMELLLPVQVPCSLSVLVKVTKGIKQNLRFKAFKG